MMWKEIDFWLRIGTEQQGSRNRLLGSGEDGSIVFMHFDKG